MKISVIIPVYNEEKVIGSCLESLAKQTYKDLEIIVIDDGSTDKSVAIIENSKLKIANLLLLKQKHVGPGAARNLGASKAKGDILVFVDADMEFEPDFVGKLIAPIVAGKSIGTFSKDEYLLNKNNVWARCWNLERFGQVDWMVPRNYPNTAPVFRAILKSKFDEARGFDQDVGYTDDWSVPRKLKTQATVAPGAKFYHRNPETLPEVWKQARWIGKNEFLTGNLIRKLYNLAKYNPFFAISLGVYGSIKYRERNFFIFKPLYDAAVFTSVTLSFLSQSKNK